MEDKLEEILDREMERWEENEKELDKFLHNIDGDTPTFMLVMMLMVKTAQTATQSGEWKKEHFVQLAASAFDDAKAQGEEMAKELH
jgi:hypothetical protein